MLQKPCVTEANSCICSLIVQPKLGTLLWTHIAELDAVNDSGVVDMHVGGRAVSGVSGVPGAL